MYNLIEYSENYRKTMSSLWNYFRDDPNNPHPANYYADPIINYRKLKEKKLFIGV